MSPEKNSYSELTDGGKPPLKTINVGIPLHTALDDAKAILFKWDGKIRTTFESVIWTLLENTIDVKNHSIRELKCPVCGTEFKNI